MCLILISDLLCLPKAMLSTKNSRNSALLSFGKVFGIQFYPLAKNLITPPELYLCTHSLCYLFQIPPSLKTKSIVFFLKKKKLPLIHGFWRFFPILKKKAYVLCFFVVEKLNPPVIHYSKIYRFEVRLTADSNSSAAVVSELIRQMSAETINFKSLEFKC